MMTRMLGVILVALGAVACSGSSSGGSGGTCNWPGACGGNLVGSWKLTSECELGKASDPSCPNATISVSPQVSGTISFASDGTYAGGGSVTGTESLVLPASCLNGVSDCASLGPMFKAQNSFFTSASCSGKVSSSCSCTLTFSSSDSGGGTWSVSGNVLTITNSSGTVSTHPFCVKGNTVTYDTQNSDGTEVVVTGSRI